MGIDPATHDPRDPGRRPRDRAHAPRRRPARPAVVRSAPDRRPGSDPRRASRLLRAPAHRSRSPRRTRRVSRGSPTAGSTADCADDLMRLAVTLAREARDDAATRHPSDRSWSRPRSARTAPREPTARSTRATTARSATGGWSSSIGTGPGCSPRPSPTCSPSRRSRPSRKPERSPTVLAALPDVPAWVSFSCRDEAHIADGTPIEDAARIVAAVPSVVAIGVNCTPGRFITPLLHRLRDATPLPAVVYPNAGGRWDASARRWSDDAETGPRDLAAAAGSWAREGATWIGGCCGFGVDAIEELARRRVIRSMRPATLEGWRNSLNVPAWAIANVRCVTTSGPCGHFGTSRWCPPCQRLRKQSLRPRGSRRAVMPAGRICAGEGCQTRLSVYNHGDRCAVCADKVRL